MTDLDSRPSRGKRGHDSLARLMLVTDCGAQDQDRLLEVLAESNRAGLRLLQIRERELSDRQVARFVQDLRERLSHDTTLIVNDRPHVAKGLGIGLHFPARSTAPTTVPPAPLVGRSVHGRQELLRAQSQRSDYLVAGHLFDTGSKPGTPGRGLPWLLEMCVNAAPTPVFAIGGINADNTAAALQAGAHGVAVCSFILSSQNPFEATSAILTALESPAIGGSSRQESDATGS